MSSDNYYTIRRKHGKWEVWMGFMSDSQPPWTPYTQRFLGTLTPSPCMVFSSEEEAQEWAEAQYAEYGVIDL